MYFQHIDRHLKGEAAEWVLHTPSVRALIYKGFMDDATESDIDNFYGALSDRFKLTLEESQNLRDTDSVIALRQGADESLEQYTGRFRDKFSMPCSRDAENDTLTSSEIAVRFAIIAQYTLGLYSKKLKEHLCQQLLHHAAPNLSQVQTMAEAVTRIMEAGAKAEARKSREQESNDNKKRKLASQGEEMDSGEKKKHRVVSLKTPRFKKEDTPSERTD